VARPDLKLLSKKSYVGDR